MRSSNLTDSVQSNINAINLFEQAPALIAILQGKEGIVTLFNPMFSKAWGGRKVIGKTMRDAFPELEGQGWFEVVEEVYGTGKPVVGSEKRALADWNNNGTITEAYFNFVYAPYFDSNGVVTGVMIFGFDVTGHVLARNKIQENEKMLANLANAMPQVVWIAEPNGAVTYYNDRVQEFSGAEKLGDGRWKWEGVVHEDDLEGTAEAWQRSVATGAIYEKEHRIRMQDGTFRWFLSRGIPQRDNDGKIKLWFGTATDIHLQKLSEERLRFASILNENIADAVIGTDLQHRIVSWNSAAEIVYGWKREEVIGKAAVMLESDFFSNERRNQFFITLQREGRWQGEVTQKTKNGKRIHIHSSVAAILEDGNVTGYVVVNRNIEEQKKAEEAVRTTTEQLQLTFKNFPSGIYLFDLNGSLLYANEMAAHFGGYASAEEMMQAETLQNVKQRSVDMFEFFTESGEPLSPEDMPTTAVKQTGKAHEMVFSVRNKSDNSVTWRRVSSAPLFATDGSLKMILTTAADITQSKTAEKKVKDSESRYRHIFEGTPVSIWEEDFSLVKKAIDELSASGVYDMRKYLYEQPHELDRLVSLIRIKDVNKATVELIEGNNKEEALNSIAMLMGDGARDAFIGEMETIATGGGDFKFETVIKNLKGRAVPVLVHIDFPRDNNYETVLVTLVDISDRKEVEVKLKRLAEATLAISATRDLNAALHEITNQARHIIGAHQAVTSMLQKDNWTKAIHAISLSEKYQGWENFTEVPDGSGIYSLVSRSNKPIRLTQEELEQHTSWRGFGKHAATHPPMRGWLAVPLIAKDGKNLGLIQLSDKYEGDFTATDQVILMQLAQFASHFIEKAESDQSLKESEERFRLLAVSIPQIVWTTTPEGKTEYLSSRWQDVTGQSIEEGLKNSSALVHPDDVDHLIHAWEKAIAEGTPWQVEYRLRSIITGEYRWFSGAAAPLKDKEGKILKWIGAATDIHSLKEQSSLLEDEVDRRTRELQQSNENLQQFAHVASHDLKEPLRKIKTFIDRLEREEGKMFSERAKNYIERINKSTDRMISMVEGVLRYSTIDSTGQLTERIDLNGLFDGIEAELELLIQEKSADISRDILPTIEGAPVLIFQLFYNILNNSLKFGKKNERLSIRITGEIICKDHAEYALIIVSDNGIGFDQQYADRIFDTFARLNSKDQYEGTGLGLSLCKKIVTRHNGRIWAEGEVDKGTSLFIELPMKQHRQVI